MRVANVHRHVSHAFRNKRAQVSSGGGKEHKSHGQLHKWEMMQI